MVKTTDVTLFGHSASECIAWKRPRPLHCVEFFAGVQSVHRAAERRGLKSAAYDILCSGVSSAGFDAYNITMKEGFDHALELALSIEEGGLMMVAPLCSSFSATCKATHKRSSQNNYYGDVSLEFVTTGNSIAAGAAFLVIVGKGRNVQILFENPPNSDIYRFPPVREALDFAECCHEAIVKRCAYDLGKHRIGKSFKFLGSEPWVEQLRRPCTCLYPHLPLSKSFIQKDTGRSKHVGEKRWTGIKERLVESGAYPVALGECTVGAWLREDLENLFTAPRVPLQFPAANSVAPKRKSKAKSQLRGCTAVARSVGLAKAALVGPLADRLHRDAVAPVRPAILKRPASASAGSCASGPRARATAAQPHWLLPSLGQDACHSDAALSANQSALPRSDSDHVGFQPVQPRRHWLQPDP